MNQTNQATPQTITPLYARKTIEDTNLLRQMALCGKLNIRGNSEDSALSDALKSAIEIDLPGINGVSERKSNRLFGLGPNEWLLYCDLDQVEQIGAAISEQMGDRHHAVTEVSDYYTVIRLRGPDAESLIRRGSPLDIHPDKFQSGDMAQTRFGHASILLYKQSDGESWDIQVRWSYAEYVWDYLVSAMNCLQPDEI